MYQKIVSNELLTVQQLKNQFSVYFKNNFVGINNTNPTESLHVNGNIKGNNFLGNGSNILNLNANNCLDCSAIAVGDSFIYNGEYILVVDRAMLDQMIIDRDNFKTIFN